MAIEPAKAVDSDTHLFVDLDGTLIQGETDRHGELRPCRPPPICEP